MAGGRLSRAMAALLALVISGQFAAHPRGWRPVTYYVDQSRRCVARRDQPLQEVQMNGEAKRRLARVFTIVVAMLLLACPPHRPALAQEGAPQSVEPAVLAGLVPVAESDQPVVFETILQQGYHDYAGCRDTEMDAWQPQESLEGQADLHLRAWDIKDILIKYDLRSIPPRSRIRSARLALYALEPDRPYSLQVRAFRVIRPWDVSEVTWEWAEVADGHGPIYWGTAGCNHTLTDRYAEPEDVITIGETGVWHEFDITSLVEDWIANPSLNQGLVLKADPGPHTEYALAASEHSIQSWRPKLIVTYASPSYAYFLPRIHNCLYVPEIDGWTMGGELGTSITNTVEITRGVVDPPRFDLYDFRLRPEAKPISTTAFLLGEPLKHSCQYGGLVPGEAYLTMPIVVRPLNCHSVREIRVSGLYRLQSYDGPECDEYGQCTGDLFEISVCGDDPGSEQEILTTHFGTPADPYYVKDTGWRPFTWIGEVEDLPSVIDLHFRVWNSDEFWNTWAYVTDVRVDAVLDE
jgi:hypothetical protein